MIELKKYSYASDKPGPKLLVLGCVHGNEVCGKNAIERVMKNLDSKRLKLEYGSAQFIPVCNPIAFEAGERWQNDNLNRLIGHHEHFQTYEYELATQIATAIDECDAQLDIHSVSARGSKPFVFKNPKNSKEITDYVDAQGITIITGWNELYPPKEGAVKTMGDTGWYAKANGKISATIECGTNGTKAADNLAYNAIIRSMAHLGLIKSNLKSNAVADSYHMSQIVRYEKPGKFVRQWKNFEYIPHDTIIAKYEDGSTLWYPESFNIIMPKTAPKIGDEWFYKGFKRQRD